MKFVLSFLCLIFASNTVLAEEKKLDGDLNYRYEAAMGNRGTVEELKKVLAEGPDLVKGTAIYSGNPHTYNITGQITWFGKDQYEKMKLVLEAIEKHEKSEELTKQFIAELHEKRTGDPTRSRLETAKGLYWTALASIKTMENAARDADHPLSYDGMEEDRLKDLKSAEELALERRNLIALLVYFEKKHTVVGFKPKTMKDLEPVVPTPQRLKPVTPDFEFPPRLKKNSH